MGKATTLALEFLTRTNRHSVTPSRRGAGLPGDGFNPNGVVSSPRLYEPEWEALTRERIQVDGALSTINRLLSIAMAKKQRGTPIPTEEWHELQAWRQAAVARTAGLALQLRDLRRLRQAHAEEQSLSFEREFMNVARGMLTPRQYGDVLRETGRRLGWDIKEAF